MTTDIDKDVPLEEIKLGDVTRKKFPAGHELWSKRHSDYIGSAGYIISLHWECDEAPFPDDFGEFQYTYTKGENRISLLEVEGLDWTWESYCLNGDLFDDIEKFDSREQGEKRILELLK